MATEQNTSYQVYLVRLWQEIDPVIDSDSPLRILVEEPQSGERHSFNSLGALNHFFESMFKPSKSIRSEGGTP